MTDNRRIAFFRVVRDAFQISGFGSSYDAWRKVEMAKVIPGCDSVSKVKSKEDYEALMLHFGILAQDEAVIKLYSDPSERRHRFVLKAIEADLEYLRGKGCDDAYMEAIYKRAVGVSFASIDDIPADQLKLVVQIADSFSRRLRRKARVTIDSLPSAHPPFCIRGVNPGSRS